MCSKIRIRIKVKTPVGSQRSERRQASSPENRGYRQIVFAGTGEEAIALGTLGWAGATPKPHAGSSDGDTAIELLGEVMAWLVFAWFGRQGGMKNQVCDDLDFFQAQQTV